MKRFPAHRTWSAACLCVALTGLVACHREPAPLADGRESDTPGQSVERKELLASFGEPTESATSESLEAIRKRMADTGVAYDFLWRTHLPAAVVADLDAKDPGLDPHPGDTFTGAMLIAPGIWVSRSPPFAPQIPDRYVIRAVTRFKVRQQFWDASANFSVPPDMGGPALALSCAAYDGHFQPVPPDYSYGYCSVPAPHGRYDLANDADLLKRLARLQTEGPPPGLVEARIKMGQAIAASGTFEANRQRDHAASADWQKVVAKRERDAMPEIYGTRAVLALVLLGLPAFGFWLAVKRRRTRASKRGSGVFGGLCLLMAATAAVVASRLGAWGLLAFMLLGAFAIAAGVAGILALIGAMRRPSE